MLNPCVQPLLVDSSNFGSSSGGILCALDEVDVLITDGGLEASMRQVAEAAGVRVIIA